jgi:hypothetical protein
MTTNEQPMAASRPHQGDVVEAVAKAIYEQWELEPGYNAWTEGSNSHMQDNARRLARDALAGRLSAAQPQPAHSKSEYKRRVAMGDSNVMPPAGVPQAQAGTCGGSEACIAICDQHANCALRAASPVAPAAQPATAHKGEPIDLAGTCGVPPTHKTKENDRG